MIAPSLISIAARSRNSRATMPSVQQLPSELLGALPRDVRLTGGGKTVLGVAAGLAAAAVALAFGMAVAYTQSREARDLRLRDGVQTSAEIVSVVVRRSDDTPRRVATYAYTADDRSFTGRVTLRGSSRLTAAEGGTLPITYLRSNPARSWVVGYEPRLFPLFPIPLTLVTLLVVAAMVARSVIQQRTLLEEGRAVLGRVVDQKKINSDKRRAYRITCEFDSLSGARQTTKYQVSSMPPAVGSLVTIVYHRDNPKWSAAYPFGLVRTIRQPS